MLSDLSVRPPEKQAPGYAEETGSLPEKLGRHKKKVLAFTVLLTAVAFGLCSLSLLSFKGPVFPLQVAGFFALGYLHDVILRANVAQLSPAQKLSYTFLLAFLLGVVVLVFFLLFGAVSPLAIAAFACAFAWPYALQETSRQFGQVYYPPVAVWQYSPELSLQKSTTFLNSIPVRFRIYAGRLGEDGRVVSFRAPVRMKLGAIFYHTVQDQNRTPGATIHLSSPENEPYAWQFSVSGFLGPRHLDPELSLFENGVKENAVVTARRLNSDFFPDEI